MNVRLPVGVRSLVAAGAVAGAGLVICAYAVWPVMVGLLVALAVVLALAVRAPAAAFVSAVVAFGAEGTIKEILSAEGVPIAISPVSLGAVLLDVALFGAVLGLIVRDRGETSRAVWPNAPRLERLVLLALGVWLLVSVPQIAQSGDLHRGLLDFRLTQIYALAGFAGAILFARATENAERVVGWLLAGFALVAGYAAFRGLVGPSPLERNFALSKLTVVQYGAAFRDVGSFSSSVGLESYLVPVFAFSVSWALWGRAHRALASFVTVTSAVGLAETYGRAPLLACAGALLIVGVLFASRRSLTRRARVRVGVAVLAIILTGAGLAVLVNGGSHATSSRLHDLLTPWRDPSVRQRITTLGRDLSRIAHHPFGAGLGTVGASTRSATTNAASTADDSYLAVLIEQGVIVGLAFMVGIVGVCVAGVRRLWSVPQGHGAAALAALTGLVAFLLLMLSGEYIEQPGKVVAWTLAGGVVGYLLGRSEPRADDTQRPTLTQSRYLRPRRAAAGVWMVWQRQPLGRQLLVGSAALAAAVIPLAFNASRGSWPTASVQLIPVRVFLHRPRAKPETILRLIDLPETQSYVERAIPAGDRAAGMSDLTVRRSLASGPTGRVPAVTLSVSATSATAALALARADALGVIHTTTMLLRRAADERHRKSESAALRRMFLSDRAHPRSNFALGSHTVAHRARSWSDRLSSDVSSSPTEAANPLLAGLFGVLLVALVWLVLTRPRSAGAI